MTRCGRCGSCCSCEGATDAEPGAVVITIPAMASRAMMMNTRVRMMGAVLSRAPGPACNSGR